MIVEFIKDRDEVNEVRNRETKEIMALQQECYFHLPNSAFPVQGKLRVVSRMPIGKYTFEPEYRIGRFGDLEINPFHTPKLTPVAAAPASSSSSAAPSSARRVG